MLELLLIWVKPLFQSLYFFLPRWAKHKLGWLALLSITYNTYIYATYTNQNKTNIQALLGGVALSSIKAYPTRIYEDKLKYEDNLKYEDDLKY